jgi:hypothetical protein
MVRPANWPIAFLIIADVDPRLLEGTHQRTSNTVRHVVMPAPRMVNRVLAPSGRAPLQHRELKEPRREAFPPSASWGFFFVWLFVTCEIPHRETERVTTFSSC